MERRTYVKDGRVRIAETPTQHVQLEAEGWRLARPADPDPPASDAPAGPDGQQQDGGGDQQDAGSADPPPTTKTTPSSRRGGKGANTKH